MKPVRKLDAGEVKYRDLSFAGDDGLLFFTSSTADAYGFLAQKYELTQAFYIPIDPTGEIAPVFSKNRKLNSSIFGRFGIRHVGSQWLGYFGAMEFALDRTGHYVFDRGNPALYSVDFSSLKTKRVASSAGSDTDRSWRVGADGSVAAIFNLNRDTGDWEVRNGRDDIIQNGNSPDGSVGLIGLGKTGKTVIYGIEDPNDDKTHWFEIPLAGGEPKPFLEDVEVNRLYWDHDTGSLLGYLEDGVQKKPVFFDPGKQKVAEMVRQAFAGRNPRLMGWSRDFSRVIVRTDGGRDSGTWFVVDMATLHAKAVGFERPQLPPEKVGPTSDFDYSAQDGLELDGILTLPPSGASKNLPVVVLPHGGPHSYDGLGFDWWAQAFASRGYAVFQPNFRGSTNRDDAFERASYGEWGRKMQTDISDGVAALATKGIVDPKRACIVGASYGGYAALAGVTIQHGLYRCAVAVAGVSDIAALYNTEVNHADGAQLISRNRLEEFGPKSGWDAISPRKQAANADAPILLIHGKDDTVVMFKQSTLMADALKAAGKPYEFVTLDGEDHWLSRSETRDKMLEAAMKFVEKYNPSN
ncbi:alpha/beta hydrolase family protein [Tsuneonella mangrovi]|uniref:alpha/beta hydrolase family protein n=1 Tax=Tsuneonella mangrovi TaxID=1982042 RepID=UPI001F0B1A3E|nr:alpha/beta fold hydrolase [Tsuneonella mangrovi]